MRDETPNGCAPIASGTIRTTIRATSTCRIRTIAAMRYAFLDRRIAAPRKARISPRIWACAKTWTQARSVGVDDLRDWGVGMPEESGRRVRKRAEFVSAHSYRSRGEGSREALVDAGCDGRECSPAYPRRGVKGLLRHGHRALAFPHDEPGGIGKLDRCRSAVREPKRDRRLDRIVEPFQRPHGHRRFSRLADAGAPGYLPSPRRLALSV